MATYDREKVGITKKSGGKSGALSRAKSLLGYGGKATEGTKSQQGLATAARRRAADKAGEEAYARDKAARAVVKIADVGRRAANADKAASAPVKVSGDSPSRGGTFGGKQRARRATDDIASVGLLKEKKPSSMSVVKRKASNMLNGKKK